VRPVEPAAEREDRVEFGVVRRVRDGDELARSVLVGLGAANGDNEAQRPDAGNHPTATCHNAPYLGGECAVTERKLPKKTDRHDSGSGAPHQT